MGAAARKLGPEWPTEIDAYQLSEMTTVSVRYLRDLKKKGIVFQGSKPGMYLFPESFHGFLDYLRTRTAEAGALSPLTIEKAKSSNVRRRIAEHELAQMQSEILTKQEVEEAWKYVAAITKRAALAFPAAAMKALPHLTAFDEKHFRTLVVDLLDDLADEARDIGVGADPDLLRPTNDERAGIKPRRKRK